MATAKAWVEAIRLRTLPASISGVLAGTGCACHMNGFRLLPCIICLLFAVMAQIVSNFANEYFDYRNGLDAKGREGFRRGVTEGDISPRAMLNAVIILMAVTCALGCSLLIWGGWWLIPIGIAIAVFAIAYSAGPWPLSHHGLGEIAVVIFFGILPVTLTAYLQTGSWSVLPLALPLSLALGLMIANIMIVNNYRDYDDDRKVGKRTLAVIIGTRATAILYMANAIAATIITVMAIIPFTGIWWMLGPVLYVNLSWLLWTEMKASRGHELNPVLGKTAMLVSAFALWLLITLACN